MRGSDTEDQARCRKKAIIGAQYGSAQPTEATYVVLLCACCVHARRLTGIIDWRAVGFSED
jgi:hypothetical protein